MAWAQLEKPGGGQCQYQCFPITNYLLIQQAKLKFMHAITYNYAPSSFAKILELNMNRNPEITLRNSQLYTLPNPRTELFK
jgi:hypothetical protein